MSRIANINNLSLFSDFKKENIRHIEIPSLFNSFKIKLFQTRESNSYLKLPKLTNCKSYQNLIKRKIDKIRALNSRNRKNLGEKKIKAELSNLFNVQQIKDLRQTLSNFIKIKQNISQRKKNHNKSNSINNSINNSLNAINSFTYNSNYKNKIYSLKNISNNNIKKKIYNMENSKNNFDDFNKINNGFCFIKKNYYIKKQNFNKDIFNLINSDNNRNIFFHNISKSTKNDEFNSNSDNDFICDIEAEKNES